MVKAFLKRVKSQAGMSGVLVALLLVIVGVGLIAGINTFMQNQSTAIQNSASTAITNATNVSLAIEQYIDTADYSTLNSSQGISVNMNVAGENDSTSQQGLVGDDGYGSADTLIDIERIVGSKYNDEIIGDIDDNIDNTWNVASDTNSDNETEWILKRLEHQFQIVRPQRGYQNSDNIRIVTNR